MLMPNVADRVAVAPPPVRVASMDAYRGFVMFLMMAEVLRFGAVSHALPHSGFWQFLAHQQSHVAWLGCTLHDLIQPSFTFLVGVALPFSMAIGVSPFRRCLSLFFQLLPENVDTFHMIWLLRLLQRHYRRHVAVVWDRWNVHQSATAYFKERHPTWFTFEPLPLYSPELNRVTTENRTLAM